MLTQQWEKVFEPQYYAPRPPVLAEDDGRDFAGLRAGFHLTTPFHDGKCLLALAFDAVGSDFNVVGTVSGLT
jgi:hypothetical protein